MNALVLRMLTVPHLGQWAAHSLVALRVRGRHTGATYELPVQYARDDAGLVVMPGHSELKTWWRNLETRAEVEVLVDGGWRRGWAWVLRPGDRGYGIARRAYRERWPHTFAPEDQPFVRITVATGRRS